MDLLEKIATNEFSRHSLIEIIKRIHIPGYERARPGIIKAIKEDIIEQRSMKGFYTQNELSMVWDMMTEDAQSSSNE